MKKQPNYSVSQQIYESLDGVKEDEKVSEVLRQLKILYPEKGEQMFESWLQVKN